MNPEKKDVILRPSSELSTETEQSLNWKERWQIHNEKSEAIGRSRMAVADVLIEDGLMKKRSKK